MVLDEVFSGLWRLGAVSAAQRLGIAPDIACYAKLLTGALLRPCQGRFWRRPRCLALSHSLPVVACHACNPGHVFGDRRYCFWAVHNS